MENVPSNQSQIVGKMYRQHRSWLSSYIQRRLNCPFTTADLVQDTYLKLLGKDILPQQNDRRFLTHIARGLVIDYYRRRKIETAYLEILEQAPEEFSISAENKTLLIETLVEIDSLLQQIPQKARQAFLMRQVDGMSYKQIAAELNVSVSSVEKYVAKSLQTCALYLLQEAS